MKHYTLFDIIRGISAVLIVLYHYTTRYNQNPLFAETQTNWGITVPWGCAAVATFFILSGYLGAKNLESNSIPKRILWKRLWRLYPTFWGAVILTSIWMILFFKPAVLNWDEIFLNLSMVPGMLHARPVDGAYWTLQYELTFALFVFILMFLKNVKWWVALWIVLSILLSFIGRNDSVFASLSVLLMANYSHTFLAGMMLYAIHRDKNNICLYIILILCIINQFLWGFSIAHDIFFIITLMLIWLVVPCEKYINQKKWFIRFIVWIAAISYPLYLIHQMIGFSIIHYLQLIGLNSEVYIIVPIGICILFAYLMHKYVELPFAKK